MEFVISLKLQTLYTKIAYKSCYQNKANTFEISSEVILILFGFFGYHFENIVAG